MHGTLLSSPSKVTHSSKLHLHNAFRLSCLTNLTSPNLINCRRFGQFRALCPYCLPTRAKLLWECQICYCSCRQITCKMSQRTKPGKEIVSFTQNNSSQGPRLFDKNPKMHTTSTIYISLQSIMYYATMGSPSPSILLLQLSLHNYR